MRQHIKKQVVQWRQRATNRYYQLGAFLSLSLISQCVMADDGKDFDLSSLDTAVQNHATGDVGKLCFSIAILWVLVNLAIGKLSWRLIFTPALVAMGVGFYPTITQSLFGG